MKQIRQLTKENRKKQSTSLAPSPTTIQFNMNHVEEQN